MRYAAILAAVVGLAGVASAADLVKNKSGLRDVADGIAADIGEYLKKKGETLVAVEEVTFQKRAADSKLTASSEPLFRQALLDAFARAGLTVNAAATVKLSVVYTPKEQGENAEARQAVGVTATIKRPKDPDLSIQFGITNPQTVAILLGLSVDLPAGADDKQRGQLLKTAADAADQGKRTFALPDTTGDTVIRAKGEKGSPFGVEVRTAPAKAVKTDEKGNRLLADYAAVAPSNQDGAAFVPIKRQQVYGVVLVNDADFDAGVQLRIDGLSMYQFSDKAYRDDKGQPVYSFVIAPAKSRVIIRGWHVTNDQSDEFLVTEYGKSEAGKLLLSNADVGTITATFHAAWDPKGNPPADEPKNPHPNTLTTDATGRGARFDQKYVEVDRKVGVARGVVSVRYAK